ncbi:MAG: hypothetical protein MOGMAGMI_01854 [Candidatus Omnitrophica bacterium]|nr:hypothetical protein [Candidatus Omnitrophota bacterium]
MTEHPQRRLLRERIVKRIGTWYDWGQADCSQQIVDMVRDIAGKSAGWDMSSQGMYNAYHERPVVPMLGALWLYGSSTTNISHVRLAYDDTLAFGAEGGARTTNTVEQAKARCAFWRSCDPVLDSRKRYGPFMPDWWPWVRVTTDTLNLRDGVGTSAVILQTLPANTVVELLAGDAVQMDGYTWVRVVTSGETGYVAGEWLKR